jgi:hypothetical protein
MVGKDDEYRRFIGGTQASQNVNAAAFGELQVEDNQIGFQPADLPDGIVRPAGKTDNFDTGKPGKFLVDPVSQIDGIFDMEQAFARRVPRSTRHA